MEPGLKFTCPLCSYEGSTPELVTVHVNRAHSSPVRRSQPPPQNVVSDAYQCPMCGERFEDDVVLRHHVSEHFGDTAASATTGGISTAYARASGTSDMPICVAEDSAADGPASSAVSAAVSSEGKAEATAQCPHCDLEVALSILSDHLSAHEIALADGNQLQQQQLAEAAQEEELKVKYGMDSSGSYSSTYEQRLSRDADRQRISGLEYHHERSLLAERLALGVDSNSTATKNLIPALAAIYRSNNIASLRFVSLCCDITHYSGDRGDSGWGCGYRNVQMMLSSLMSVPEYRRRLVRVMPFLEGCQVPSIPKIQEMIEAAWRDGFDRAGAEQLNHKLCGTRKWIGPTEVAAFLRFCGIRALLVDFHCPTGPGKTHPALLEWVTRYFGRSAGNAQRVLNSAADLRPPSTSASATNASSSSAGRRQTLQPIHVHPNTFSLYFQHQGHSRTIVGVEERQGLLSLLIFDPARPPRKMATLLPDTPASARGVTSATTSSAPRHGASHARSSATGGMRPRGADVPASRLQVVRRPSQQLSAQQYQLVYADGFIANGDVARMKTLTSTRIP